MGVTFLILLLVNKFVSSAFIELPANYEVGSLRQLEVTQVA
jgi:hypothetical protein